MSFETFGDIYKPTSLDDSMVNSKHLTKAEAARDRMSHNDDSDDEDDTNNKSVIQNPLYRRTQKSKVGGKSRRRKNKKSKKSKKSKKQTRRFRK